ncbi:MAG TPA: hypothetical protein PKC91_03510 [Ignavibacteria bacterium]|nr:hypothetical protein [Ignavibacteria bacterium]
MKNFTKVLILFIASLFIIGSANSATYYVNSLTGSDANSPAQARNIATPWLSVQHAIDNASVVNGDNIVVAEGTYAGFNLTKRLNIIGVWKGSNPVVNTVFNSTVSLSATGGSAAERMLLKNLRVSCTAGDAVDVRNSYVTLENVFATTSGSGFNGVRINNFIVNDVIIESCNLNNNDRAGIYFPSFVNTDGFVVKNTTVSNNGYFGIAAFQTNTTPSVIKNVLISHCAFVDNNPTNQIQGHTIYFEKLSNATFENISVVMPPTNGRIGIDINLLSRDDYTNINIFNSRIFRSSPGSGIWIQARNDLLYPAASLDTVVLRGLTFTNCDTNIAFNRQVKNMTVDKCDLSTYSVYGLVNYTDQGGTINASNNKWQNGGTPDTTVISGGLLVTGSPIISFMPSTNGIFLGMGIVGPGIKPGTTVIGRSPNTVIMSDTAIADGFIPQIGFAFNFNTSTDIVRTSLNFTQTGNPLPNSVINQNNISFPDLASAIAGTNNGGTIWNVPAGNIAGNTIVNKDLTLISPGAGFLHAGSLTTFQDLTVTSSLMMGSDFAVTDNFTPGTTSVGENNTLTLNGNIVTGGNITGGPNSDMFFGGAGASTALTTVAGGLRTLHINRANGVSLADNLSLRRLLFLQSGLLTLAGNNLTIEKNGAIFNPFPTASYVNTNGSGVLRKAFENTTPTAFNFTVGSGNYSPVRLYFGNWTLAPGAAVNVRTVNSKHPQNQCATDYLNRYWVITQSGISDINSNLNFAYNSADVSGVEANIYGAEWDGFGWTTFTPVNAITHTFTTNGVTAFGDFSGGALDCIGNFLTLINTKAYLQGAYAGSGTMRTDLNDFGEIPLIQPYGTSQYNYNGTESVGSIPAGVVDWIYLELRETADGAPIPSGRRAAFIKSDGKIVDLDGISPVKVNTVSGNYFIVIGHRNHLPVMSANAQTLNTTSSLYDFSTGLSQYYAGVAANLGGGVFGLFAGDANKSFIITASDYTVVTSNLTLANYNQGDVNMSGIVSAADYNFITANLLRASNVPNYPPK